MKALIKLFPVLFFVCVGCGEIGGALKKHTTATPVITTIYVTNTVKEVVSSDDGTAHTNVSPVVSQTIVTNWTTNVSFTVNPAVQSFLGKAETVSENIPVPYGEYAAKFFGLLSIGLGILAKMKSDKAKILPALIAGVEAAGNADVKKAIQDRALTAGVEGELNKLVKNL